MNALILRPCFALTVQAIEMKTHTITTALRLSPDDIYRRSDWPDEFEVVFDRLELGRCVDLRQTQRKLESAAEFLKFRGYTVTTWEEHFDQTFHLRAHKDGS